MRAGEIVRDFKVSDDGSKDIILRAFIDLFDVFQFNRKVYISLTKERELKDVLWLLYGKLAEFESRGYDYKAKIQDGLENKAKHKEYFSLDEEPFIEYAQNWLVSVGICDKDWNFCKARHS